jgi:hypothetical protein
MEQHSPQNFKSRHQSLSQPMTGFDFTVSRDNKTSFELFLVPFSSWKQDHWDLAVSRNS